LEKIDFNPAIPEKIEAARKIGNGAVIKILLNFKTRWWTGVREQAFEKLFFMFSNEQIPTWWTQYPEMYTTLTGWLAGLRAAAMKDKSDEEIIDIALKSLSNIFKISIDELKKELVIAKVFNWQRDPHALGAYTYPTPETDEAVKKLLKPVGNKIFFAGEAVAESDIGGTVEAALASGQKAAELLLHHP